MFYKYIAEELIDNQVGNTSISLSAENIVNELERKGQYRQVQDFLKSYQEKFDEIEDWDKSAMMWNAVKRCELASIIEILLNK